MRTTIVMTAVLALGVAACGSDTSDEAADETTVEAPMPADTVGQAMAMLQTGEGEPAGSATATTGPAGVRISMPGSCWSRRRA